jgi:tryptophan-rich sensory protein
VLLAMGATLSAAVLGNVLISKEALAWFRSLNRPRWQLPMPGLVRRTTS